MVVGLAGMVDLEHPAAIRRRSTRVAGCVQSAQLAAPVVPLEDQAPTLFPVSGQVPTTTEVSAGHQATSCQI